VSSVDSGRAVEAAGRGAARAGAGRWRARLVRLAYLRDVTVHLVRRELSLRHRGSVLGWLWSISPALLQLVVAHFLFTRVIPLGVDDYPVFLLIGILSWSFFSGGLRSATGACEAGRNLVLRPGFPTFLQPVVAVFVELVDYLIAVPILLVAVTIATGADLTMLLLPVTILLELVLVVGLGLALAPLQVLYRDVRQFVAMAVSVGFWLTPVFYARRQVPESFMWLYDLNPMAHLIGAQREILLGGTVPSLTMLALVGLGSLVVLLGGAGIFALLRPTLPERV
jgi:ABC-type polysaccharide/polyol phosphate export permease